MMYINGSQNAHVYVANIHMFVCGQYHTTRAQPLTKPYGVHEVGFLGRMPILIKRDRAQAMTIVRVEPAIKP